MIRGNRKEDIASWGVDTRNRAATGNGGKRHVKIERQGRTVSVQRSIERPHLSPVFGTKNPPKGLSGFIRRYAYRKFSEDDLRHWLLLFFADRVDVIEHFLRDLLRGKVPRIMREVGLRPQRSTYFTRVSASYP